MTSRLRLHVDNALFNAAGAAGRRLGPDCPPSLLDGLAAFAMRAPGNVAWRAVGRLLGCVVGGD
jgi:hypothetical protein